MEMLAAPVRLHPRLDAKPWGGHRLAQLGFVSAGSEPLGEAVVTADDAVIADGPLAGQTLGSAIARDPASVLGQRGLDATGGRPLFPVLVKLIDAAQPLSIQVHPDDRLAAPLDRLGKTEAYHILGAEPGAEIALGLAPGVTEQEFAAACRAGTSTAPLVRWLPAKPGTTILIPAGTVHALGAGCFVYEVQQPSDVTYRFDDWGRLGPDGRPRELHAEPGLAALVADSRPELIAPLQLPSPAGRRHLLAACRHFALERIALAGGEETSLATASPQALTCLRGSAIVAAADGRTALARGETAVAGANAAGLRIAATAPTVLLRAWVPDLMTEVVAPARRAGHGDADVARLAGPLPDLRLPAGTRPR